MRALLLDVGNTRLKWAIADGAGLGKVHAQAHNGDPAAVIAAREWPAVDAVRVCDVTGGEMRRRLLEALAARLTVTPEVVTAEREREGLRNGYAEAQRLGADRWLAMLAAWRRSRCALCVVGAGTALTVDVVEAGGRHLGGVIAPGLVAMRRALRAATRFPLREDSPATIAGAARLGCDSESAVELGVLHALLGAIERCVSLQPDAVCYLTGGDAQHLLPFLDAGWHGAPDLVLEGLAAR